jgi:hypothetical protein
LCGKRSNNSRNITLRDDIHQGTVIVDSKKIERVLNCIQEIERVAKN